MVLVKHKQTILYGALLAVLLFLLKWLEFRFVIIDHATELYAGALAVIFTLLGIWLALKLAKPKLHIVTVEKQVYISQAKKVPINQAEVARLNISKRELEVLQLIAQGLSNQEIAERLFVSLNTVKTHTSNVFEKLGVKRRMQAVDTGKSLGIIS